VKVRALANGNVLTVVDGEPQSAAEIRRETVDPLVGLGLFEYEEQEAEPEETEPTEAPRKRTRTRKR
jgi:hypothetical protein